MLRFYSVLIVGKAGVVASPPCWTILLVTSLRSMRDDDSESKWGEGEDEKERLTEPSSMCWYFFITRLRYDSQCSRWAFALSIIEKCNPDAFPPTAASKGLFVKVELKKVHADAKDCPTNVTRYAFLILIDLRQALRMISSESMPFPIGDG
ncbi:hypothetical protein BDZ97DRAFT_1032860 [Flammula alnicola]|nr:hypothetical protein BDZ97DRAFT_1032860 [Flammula alnicola]